MAQLRWDEREAVILEAMAAAEEAGENIDRAARSAVPDLDLDRFGAVIDSLVDGHYVEAHIIRSWQRGYGRVHVKRLLPAGRRAIGQWPSGNPGEDLLRSLEALLERTTEPEKRKVVRRVLDAVREGGIDLAASIAVELGKSMAGIH